MSKNHALRIGIAISLVVMASAPQAYAQERVVVPQMTLRAAAAVTLNATFVFEDWTSSGPFGDDSNRYLWYLGTKLRISRRLVAGLSYSLGWKESARPGGDYVQNRVTLDLTHEF